MTGYWRLIDKRAKPGLHCLTVEQNAVKFVVMHCPGIAHLLFSRGGGHYTWRKVATTVHNIIVGRLWVDNHGEMDITNHKTGDICHLKYAAYSYFSRDMPHKVI